MKKLIKVRCGWFARCTSDATGTTHHPVLADVPSCDRCHKFATGEDRRLNSEETWKSK